MKRKILALITALCVGGGASITVATPAHASFDWCHGVSVVCFAEHINGNGIRWGPRSFPYGVCVGVPSNLNDKISSLWNKYGWDSSSPPLQVTLYWHNPCSRDVLYTWGPSAYVLNIGSANSDRASAVCVGPRQVGYCP